MEKMLPGVVVPMPIWPDVSSFVTAKEVEVAWTKVVRPFVANVVPASKVRVPEVKLSEVSLLRREAPSMESRVAASVQLEVTLTVPVPPRAVEPEPVAQVPLPKVIVELARAAF